MKKYFVIFKMELANNMQYVFNIVSGLIGFFIILFIYMHLWQYLYSDSSQLINGYSMNQIIYYVTITEILWSCLSGKTLCKKICNDVRSGNIAYNLNKPYSYIGYTLASHLSDMVFKLVIYIILGLLISLLFIKEFPNLTLISILAVLITMLLALIISTLLITSIGLFSFYIEDANPFYWVYSKFILILGTIFPIEYFPRILQKILKFSPIYVVSYGPAKLFVDFSLNNFISILFSQIIYIFLSYLLCSLIYKKGVKKLNVNGG